jgi:SAM-dependent methyltransferase
VTSQDAWAIGAGYEPYIGRWSRLVAREFVPWLGIKRGATWLDVGCGTGELTRAVLDLADPQNVVGIDPSDGFLAYARAHTDERARFEHGDARSLPADDATFDAVVSGLVLNFVPTPEQAVDEMVRVARPGATVAAYVWDYADQMQLIRYCWDVAVALHPGAAELDEGRRFNLCDPHALRSVFGAAGLERIEPRAIDVPTVFRDFDDYWSPFLAGQGPAPTYVMSLSDSAREQLRERLRATLPIAADGSIHLTARAWAIQGVRPVR